VVVNLHAQLNMLGGLMMMLVGLALGLLAAPRLRLASVATPVGIGCYYVAGVALAAVQAHRVEHGQSFAAAVAGLEPWSALVLVPASLAVLAGFGSYALAAWRLTSGERIAGRQEIRAMPGRFTGTIPMHVRRRSPASVAAYELPLGIMGFPGLGWLFAGFPITASLLLTGGPSLAWAVIPAGFSPFGGGPFRGIGWKIELVWLPATTLLSAALLYRAQARRRAALEGRPPRGRRSRSSYRTRVSVAVGAILLLLVSIPFVPAVAGIGEGSVRYSYQPRLTREITGQFLSTPRGVVKLFAWRDPQGSYPSDALRVHAGDVRSLVVRAAAVDAAPAYQLYDLSHGGSVPLVVRAASPTSLALRPARSLAPGRYVFTATHEGMFGGRDFAYMTVVPPGAPTTAIRSETGGTAPAVVDSLIPVAAALVAALFSLLLLRSLARRFAGQKLLWAIGFALFAAASASEALATRTGWTPGLFRAYYTTGGVLTVAYLGAGSAWLLLPRRARDMLLGGLLVATTAAVAAVALAPVDAGLLAGTPSGRPPLNHALGGHAFLWAIGLNSVGTIFLVGGSLWSIAHRQRIRANVWIGGGALVVALATGLSRTGTYSFVYLGELVGISLMFAGFTLKPAPARRARYATPTAAPLSAER
jgi:hypothetical protein